MGIILIVIDMQFGFINQYTKHLEQKICDYIDANNFDTVIATQYINHKDSACYRNSWTKVLAGSKEADLLPAIKKRADIILQKDCYSCWIDDLTKADTIYFCGIDTDCCVMQSACDAYEHLQDFYVLSDLCGSTAGWKVNKYALEIMRKNLIGRVV